MIPPINQEIDIHMYAYQGLNKDDIRAVNGSINQY